MNVTQELAKDLINRAIFEIKATYPLNSREIQEVLISAAGDMAVRETVDALIPADVLAFIERYKEDYMVVYGPDYVAALVRGTMEEKDRIPWALAGSAAFALLSDMVKGSVK